MAWVIIESPKISLSALDKFFTEMPNTRSWLNLQKYRESLVSKITLRKVLPFNGQKRQYSHIHVIDAQFAVEMFAYVTAEPHRLMPETYQLKQTHIITTTIFDYQLKCPMFFSFCAG